MQNYPEIRKLLAEFKLVLASGSPRRISILNSNAIPFRQIIPNINEVNHHSESPSSYAERLAAHKAAAVFNRIRPDEIVLGCDTIVILNDQILEKPDTPAHAVQMLSALSGRKHTVCSAISLLESSGHSVTGSEFTDVYFNRVSPDEIEKYVRSGEPLDKAGAYGIQEEGRFLVDRIEGNIDNVIGLPMTLFDHLAAKICKEIEK